MRRICDRLYARMIRKMSRFVEEADAERYLNYRNLPQLKLSVIYIWNRFVIFDREEIQDAELAEIANVEI